MSEHTLEDAVLGLVVDSQAELMRLTEKIFYLGRHSGRRSSSCRSIGPTAYAPTAKIRPGTGAHLQAGYSSSAEEVHQQLAVTAHTFYTLEFYLL